MEDWLLFEAPTLVFVVGLVVLAALFVASFPHAAL